MRRLSRSFSARLTTTILLITSILFVAAITVVSYFSHKLIGEEATKNASNVLNTATLDINMTLEKIEESVVNVQWLVKENLHDTAYLYHITEEVVLQNEEIVGSAIAFIPNFFSDKYYFSPYSYNDTLGKIYSKQLGNDAYDYFEMEWFKVAYQTGKAHWSRPYFDEGGGQRLMSTFSLPLFDDSGKVFAIFTADIDLYWLHDKICSLRPYVNSQAVLLTQEGNYISGNQPEMQEYQNIYTLAENLNSVRLKELGDKMTSGDSGTIQLNKADYPSFAVYGPLANGWTAAIISPYKDVFVHVMRMNLIIIIVSSFGLFLLFILCFRIVRKLTQPITEFSVAALNMAKGNFQARLPQVNTQDEMRQLYNSFEYMQKSLVHYIEELRTTTFVNERYESELNIARNIQLQMVPTDFPVRDDLSVYAVLHPAREVGGDLYDFLIKDDIVYFAIGDVSGKGVPAALLMAVTRAAFRFLGGLNLPISTMMGRINNCLSEGNSNAMFVTLFAGCVNLKTGEMKYCNAGHNPLVLCHADGTTEFLHVTPNLATGVFPDFTFEEGKFHLEKGSRLLLYTDGVTEAEDSNKNQYGEDRLLEFAKNINVADSSETVVHNLMDSVKSFTQDAEQNDDITVLMISFPK